MNDNNAYIVQCNASNFEEARYIIQVFCRVLAIDEQKFCLKAGSLDSTIKQQLGDIGASFWQEPNYAVTKSLMASLA
jgi:hypothetical protein